LGWETADQWKKGIVASGWVKTAEEGGLKVQSPILASGVILGVKTHTKKINTFLLSNFFFSQQ